MLDLDYNMNFAIISGLISLAVFIASTIVHIIKERNPYRYKSGLEGIFSVFSIFMLSMDLFSLFANTFGEVFINIFGLNMNLCNLVFGIIAIIATAVSIIARINEWIITCLDGIFVAFPAVMFLLLRIL